VLGKSSAHWCLFAAVALAQLFASSSACPQTAAPRAAELKVSGAVSTPLTLTVADLKAMPRKTLTVVNPHEKKTEKYEGVALEEILRKAGVPQGDALRWTSDGYVCIGGSCGRLSGGFLAGRTGCGNCRF